MNTTEEPEARVADLEAEKRQRDEKIKELREELRQALNTVDEMREHLEDGGALIDSWIEVFDMQQDDGGSWLFDKSQSALWERHKQLLDEHEKLIKDWNRFVPDYNRTVAPRQLGRPLAASDAQVKDVNRRKKAGESLRKIAMATGLTLRTVRTIVERERGEDRASKRTNDIRKREYNRLRAASFRARKKARDGLPKRITEIQERGAGLVKVAKGLGKNV